MPITQKLLAAVLTAAFTTLAGAQAPAGSTALCKDGTFTKKAINAGACQGHKGVRRIVVVEGAKSASRTGSSASGSAASGDSVTVTSKPSAGTNPPKTTPSTTAPASSPYPIASPAPDTPPRP